MARKKARRADVFAALAPKLPSCRINRQGGREDVTVAALAVKRSFLPDKPAGGREDVTVAALAVKRSFLPDEPARGEGGAHRLVLAGKRSSLPDEPAGGRRIYKGDMESMNTTQMLSPIYTPTNMQASYRIRYGWTGWPSTGTFPPEPSDEFWQAIAPEWESDGLRLLERNWTPQKVQLTFSAKPQVSPIFAAARAKGRLQHHLRKGGSPVKFSRKVGLRSIGHNTTAEVEAYVRGQVEKEPVADPRFRELLRKYSVADPEVDLSQPTPTESGRYWYNLHLVIVTQSRFRIVEDESLAKVRDTVLDVGRRNGYGIADLSVVPDHLHSALRGNLEQSPEEIALVLLNSLAEALGNNAVWQYGYYAGTFSEYDMGAVRRGGTERG
ncbi:MAG: transposase [Armatimonadetes bacterium]|nr:transposase [Armatimonadota bacterium]